MYDQLLNDREEKITYTYNYYGKDDDKEEYEPEPKEIRSEVER